MHSFKMIYIFLNVRYDISFVILYFVITILACVKGDCSMDKKFKKIQRLSESSNEIGVFFDLNACTIESYISSDITGFKECYMSCYDNFECNGFAQIADECIICKENGTQSTILEDWQFPVNHRIYIYVWIAYFYTLPVMLGSCEHHICENNGIFVSDQVEASYSCNCVRGFAGHCCQITCDGLYGNSCYVALNLGLRWHEGVSHCNSKGGYLVEIDSEEENNAIVAIFTRLSIRNLVWIGCNKMANEDTFIWNSDGRNVSYTSWNNNVRPGNTNADCCDINKNTGIWNINLCWRRDRDTICEFDY